MEEHNKCRTCAFWDARQEICCYNKFQLVMERKYEGIYCSRWSSKEEAEITNRSW